VNESLLKRIETELRDGLIGLYLRQAYQLADNEFVIAFEGDDFKLLLIALDAREPRIYLIKRKLKDLKKRSQNPTKFVVDLEKSLRGRRVEELRKFESERVIEVRFKAGQQSNFLIVQLTGKSSNIFLLNADRSIIAAARKPKSEDQSIGKSYSPPLRHGSTATDVFSDALPKFHEAGSLSEQLDKYF
jgi:predicted ribosome quality control (RQC) complex YloA/Tae2 family protein